MPEFESQEGALTLSRDQIAAFAKDPQTIKQFELLTTTLNNLTAIVGSGSAGGEGATTSEVGASVAALEMAFGTLPPPPEFAGVMDRDYGDITVSGSGLVWTIDNDVVTFTKFQNIATGKVLGRATSGSGDVEELATTGTGSVALADSPVFTTGIDVQGLLRCNSFRIDQAPTAEVVVCTHTITISADGTDYKIPCVLA